MPDKNEAPPPPRKRALAVGDAIKYRQFGLTYPATVLAINEDGTIDLRALALNNDQPFVLRNVASTDFDPGAPSG